MMIIETRRAAKDKAFDLLDEINDLGRQKKMALCELEETLYECFESSEDDDEDYENGDYMPGDDEDMSADYRNSKSYRYKSRRGMRSGMREDDDDMDMRMRTSSNRRSMRMRRRDKMGRYA